MTSLLFVASLTLFTVFAVQPAWAVSNHLPRQFSGQRWDSEAGLYFYGARCYDPALGRFIQPDSLVPNPGDPQDLNRYTYGGTLAKELCWEQSSGLGLGCWGLGFRMLLET